MFKNEYKDKYEKAIDANKSMQDILNELSSRDQCTVIKLIPDCDSMFYLNGDLIADDSRAIYRGYKLNASECVLYKAGKESVRAEMDNKIAEFNKLIEDLKDQVAYAKAQLLSEQEYSQSLKNKLNSQLSLLAEERKLNDDKIQALMISHDNDLSELQNRINELLSENEHLQKELLKLSNITNIFENVQIDDDILTPYGVVRS